jgi:superfamily I DNA/RNA helicase
MRRTLVLGGPGAGKTYRLLQVMEEAMDNGVRPNRIAFVSFTTAAADEAKRRAMEKFGFEADELPYFRTLHSLVFRELGIRRDSVLCSQHLAELSELTGELMGSADNTEEGPASAGMSADPMLTIDHYARTTLQPLRVAWEEHGGELDWFRLKRFVDSYSTYRTDKGLIDFTDMLEQYAKGNASAIPIDLAIIDEAQDFTLLQWQAALKAFAGAHELWVAGDDLQSIHRWAGAAEDYFLSLDGYEIEVLPLSHRLPRSIFDLAGQVAARVARKYDRSWTHSGRPGAINWFAQPSEVSLDHGTWLMLARTRAQLGDLVETAREQGVIYRMKGASSVSKAHVAAIQSHESLRAGKGVYGFEATACLKAAGRKNVNLVDEETYTATDLKYDASLIWHDALVGIALETREYYLACMRRGEKLTQEPRVRIETIHGAKGAEAQNVLLRTDLTYKVQRGLELDPDAEARVFYVGLTRASETLNIITPQTQYGYRL